MRERRGRVIFVNRFFWPDHSATSQILSDVAFALAGQGIAVEVVTSRLSYSDTKLRYPARETKDNVTIHRVATTGFGRAGTMGRALDLLSFYAAACWRVWRCARAGDVVVVKTDPPLLSVPMRLVAKARRARQVNWLQDIYPEVAARLGMRIFDGAGGRWLTRLRDRSLGGSAMNVAIGERMADVMRGAGIAGQRIAVIPNFVDDEAIRPLAAADNALRTEWGYGPDDFVVGYSGNLGKAHDLDTVVDAAEYLLASGRGDTRFLFVGGGALRERLEREIARRGLTNIDLKPYQPRHRLAESLTVPDIHWMTLRPALEGYIVPSKYYGALAAGRPVLFIGDAEGEIGREIAAQGCGWTMEEGDVEGLASLLMELADNRAQTREAGDRARAAMDRNATRARRIESWRQLLDGLTRLAP